MNDSYGAGGAAEAVRKQVGVADRQQLTGIRVLFVEDDEDTRDMMILSLGLEGASVTAVACASEALEALDRELPDILLSDTGLPSLDGWTLIERMRARDAERGGRVPAIAVTGHAGEHDVARSLAAGFDAHLAKPVGRDELIAAIVRLTDARRTDDAG